MDWSLRELLNVSGKFWVFINSKSWLSTQHDRSGSQVRRTSLTAFFVLCGLNGLCPLTTTQPFTKPNWIWKGKGFWTPGNRKTDRRLPHSSRYRCDGLLVGRFGLPPGVGDRKTPTSLTKGSQERATKHKRGKRSTETVVSWVFWSRDETLSCSPTKDFP